MAPTGTNTGDTKVEYVYIRMEGPCQRCQQLEAQVKQLKAELAKAKQREFRINSRRKFR